VWEGDAACDVIWGGRTGTSIESNSYEWGAVVVFEAGGGRGWWPLLNVLTTWRGRGAGEGVLLSGKLTLFGFLEIRNIRRVKVINTE
jgi:hypothetical protein